MPSLTIRRRNLPHTPIPSYGSVGRIEKDLREATRLWVRVCVCTVKLHFLFFANDVKWLTHRVKACGEGSGQRAGERTEQCKKIGTCRLQAELPSANYSRPPSHPHYQFAASKHLHSRTTTIKANASVSSMFLLIVGFGTDISRTRQMLAWAIIHTHDRILHSSCRRSLHSGSRVNMHMVVPIVKQLIALDDEWQRC